MSRSTGRGRCDIPNKTIRALVTWSLWSGLNRRPPLYGSGALPSELHRQELDPSPASRGFVDSTRLGASGVTSHHPESNRGLIRTRDSSIPLDHDGVVP